LGSYSAIQAGRKAGSHSVIHSVSQPVSQSVISSISHFVSQSVCLHSLHNGSPNRDPPCCTMRAEDSFVTFVYAIKISQQFRHFGIPLTVVFPRGAREPANNKGCGPLPYKGWRHVAQASLITSLCIYIFSINDQQKRKQSRHTFTRQTA